MKQKLLRSEILAAVILIVCLHVIEQFGVDCYLPSFPAIAKSLHVENHAVQLSITFFLLGAAAAQFVFGTLSDSFGRRPLNIAGVIIFVLSSFLCLFAINIHMFLWGRLAQGFGSGAGLVLSRAALKDMFSGKSLAKLISILVIIVILLPVISPIAGGYIQHYLGWRYVFALISIMGIVLLTAIIFAFPETLDAEHKHVLHIKNIYKSYKTLFLSRVFLINALCACLTSSITIIYITITPFLYQHVLHLTPIVFGWITAFVAIGIAIGNVFNSKFVEVAGRSKMIIIGVIIMTSGVVLMLLFALMNILNLYAILLPMLVVTLSTGFIGPNAASCAIDPFHKLAGSAAALYGGMQMFIISGFSAVAATFHTQNQKPLAFLLLIVPIAIMICLYLGRQKKTTR